MAQIAYSADRGNRNIVVKFSLVGTIVFTLFGRFSQGQQKKEKTHRFCRHCRHALIVYSLAEEKVGTFNEFISLRTDLYFHKLLSRDDILLSPKTVLPSPFWELPSPESLLSSHSNNADSTFSKFLVTVESMTTLYSILLSLLAPDIYKSSVTVTLIRDVNSVLKSLLTRTAFNDI